MADGHSPDRQAGRQAGRVASRVLSCGTVHPSDVGLQQQAASCMPHGHQLIAFACNFLYLPAWLFCREADFYQLPGLASRVEAALAAAATVDAARAEDTPSGVAPAGLPEAGQPQHANATCVVELEFCGSWPAAATC